MIVIADTGPINYLVLIEEIQVLPALYGRIVIPVSVSEELKRPRAPDVVRVWIGRPPNWLEVRTPVQSPDTELANAHLDAGERDAILLAEELGADQLIIDEIRGRRIAQRRHLVITGTLGVLKAGAQQGLLDLKTAVARLSQTNFHIAQEILDRLTEER
jgi:predicted nucleic acid-binding protein